MAKRRNLKKEKAQRNQAYARQFRKRTNRSYSRNNSFSNRNNKDSGSDENNKDRSGDKDQDKEGTESRDRS